MMISREALERMKCVDQIFTLKQIGEKAREIKCRAYLCFIDLENAYDRVNREAL